MAFELEMISPSWSASAWHLVLAGGRLLLFLPDAVGLPLGDPREKLLECGFGPGLTSEAPDGSILMVAARSTEPPARASDPNLLGRPTLV